MKKEQKQHLIDMMQKDEELGLYDEFREIKMEDIFNDEKKEELKEFIDNHKQETLEEAAEKYHLKNQHPQNQYPKKAFIEGAKWQMERSYSEEEVMDMFHNLSMHLPLHYEFLVKEQFKKK